METEPRFLDPHGEVGRHSNRLPHWQQKDATYFVTFRLADSLPNELLEQWQEERASWLKLNPKPWSSKQEREHRERFTGAIERWLDEGHGACILRQPGIAQVVSDSLKFFDGVRYRQYAWVIMPNHVHLLFYLLADTRLEAQLQSWKSYTARVINREVGRSGALWQKDYHDRLVRNLKHFVNCARYIRNNPLDARLRLGEYIYYASGEVSELIRKSDSNVE